MVIFRALNGVGSHVSTDVGRSGRVFGTAFWHVEASHVVGLTVAYLHCRFGEEPDHQTEGRISWMSDGLGEGFIGHQTGSHWHEDVKASAGDQSWRGTAEQFNGQVQLLIVRPQQDYRQPPRGLGLRRLSRSLVRPIAGSRIVGRRAGLSSLPHWRC